MKTWVQNNMFAGAIAKIEGKRMEFATEDEALEYEEPEHEEVEHGSNIYI